MLAIHQSGEGCSPALEIRDCGDCAILVEFGLTPRLRGTAAILRLVQELEARKIAGFVEAIPAFSSVTLIYDPILLDRDVLVRAVFESASQDEVAALPSRMFSIPVVYGQESGPDLDAVAEATGLDPNEVVERHSACEYFVYMLGFLPGFAYLGDTPQELRLPRRSSPRAQVPAGSIAVASDMTAIYPLESPGGWHLIGKTPIKLWDFDTMEEPLLRPGDRVRFKGVEPDEADWLTFEIARGWRLEPEGQP